jgi:hypothetical protein
MDAYIDGCAYLGYARNVTGFPEDVRVIQCSEAIGMLILST